MAFQLHVWGGLGFRVSGFGFRVVWGQKARRGKGIETVGDERREIGPGTAIFIPPDVEHNVVNTGDEMLTLLVVVSPPGIVEKNLYQKRVKKATQVWQKEYFR